MIGARAERTGERGFTLVELIIAIGLLGIVFTAISTVMLATLKTNLETKTRLDETRDEQFAAAYFASDVAGALTMTGTPGPAHCGTGTAVAEFHGATFDTNVPPRDTETWVSYVFAPAAPGAKGGTLTRNVCEALTGATVFTPVRPSIVARSLVASGPTARCSTGGVTKACVASPGQPTPTTMTMTLGRLSGTPFDLTGTRRPS